MNFTEVAVGGIWVAAAINVAGYVVHSYSTTYNAFPTPGGSGGGGDIPTIIPPKVRKTPLGPPKAPAPSPVPKRVPPPVPAIPPGAKRVPPTVAPPRTVPGPSVEQPPGTITIPTPWGDIHIHPPHLPKLPSLPGLPGIPEIPVPVP